MRPQFKILMIIGGDQRDESGTIAVKSSLGASATFPITVIENYS